MYKEGCCLGFDYGLKKIGYAIGQFITYTELERFNLPIYLTDERMTTKEAKSHLFEKGGFRALSYGKVDSVAAAILLEQWMNGA